MNNANSDSNLSAADLVAQHATMKQLLPLFSNRLECAEYFARTNAELYGIDRAVAACCVCSESPSISIANYQWQARFSTGVGFGRLEALLLALGHVGIKLKYTVVSFRTFHPICKGCKRSLQTKRGIANVLNFGTVFADHGEFAGGARLGRNNLF